MCWWGGGLWKPGGGQASGMGPLPHLSPTPRRHTLSRRRIIPLPQWKANPETDPEALFQKEQLVLALYPQTTCFYRALIHTPPQRVRQPPQERSSLRQGRVARWLLASPPTSFLSRPRLTASLSPEGPAGCPLSSAQSALQPCPLGQRRPTLLFPSFRALASPEPNGRDAYASLTSLLH